uniref:Uncharacterized protein n=1 Tax=Lactuca sativa TaxID=4236 RepID=A0A9R1UQP0_LACSA|nr:hypothetical protein LSAT_V11C800426450 [Lactuca sativa]
MTHAVKHATDLVVNANLGEFFQDLFPESKNYSSRMIPCACLWAMRHLSQLPTNDINAKRVCVDGHIVEVQGISDAHLKFTHGVGFRRGKAMITKENMYDWRVNNYKPFPSVKSNALSVELTHSDIYELNEIRSRHVLKTLMDRPVLLD